MKVLVVGNSVSVRVRPPEDKGQNFTFSNIIESQLSPKASVFTIAESGLMINDFAKNPDRLITAKPDVLISNFGIVELSSRSINRSLYDFLYYKKVRSKFGRTFQLMLSIIETKFRIPLVYLRFKRPWYNLSLFIKDYFELITRVQRETGTKFIVLGINLPNSRVEKQLPGSIKRVQKANEIIENKCLELDNVYYIPVDSELDHESHFPDGIHYNKLGHEMIADKIKSVIATF
jgi:lysophospholipase L1-like esterase